MCIDTTLTPELQEITPIACVAVHVFDDYFAMMGSGTNAIIVPLHPDVSREIAECKVPGATVQGPIVQVLEHRGERRLVVALPQSAILISQEWLTTAARWTVVAKSKGTSSQVEVYASRCRGSCKTLVCEEWIALPI